jgi:16S rRNA (cytidine1402-2'-O)-methyltransferase
MSRRASQEHQSIDGGVLYVVATPIGNLGDVSSRALETLRAVDLVLCEDTRRTRKLLMHHGIETRTTSFHEHNEEKKVPSILAQLNGGARIALVSDAGTPTISDPGYRLINTLCQTDIPIIPIPGPSAVTALLSVSGLPTDRFVFEGFLPVKSGKRRKRLEELAAEPRTIVLFESPFRIARTLAECVEVLGDRRCCFGRELTKEFEEIHHGTLAELAQWGEGRKFKGEIVLAIAGAKARKSE